MDIEEDTLRHMLSSQHGSEVGQRLLEKVQKGEPFDIAMNDGTKISLSSPAKAVQVLIDHFDWKRVIDWKNHAPAAYVMGICRRLESRFTLAEIVARIQDERPEMVLEFASAWSQLLKHRFIRKMRHNDPLLFEVHADHEWV